MPLPMKRHRDKQYSNGGGSGAVTHNALTNIVLGTEVAVVADGANTPEHKNPE
jgi:hypothetical protein